ncbi:MAG: phosphopantetheine-binding protein [Chloroflexota bacterium]
MKTVPFDEIRQIVKLKLGARQVDASSRLIEDLRAESMDIVRLAATVEERYGVTIKESELARIKTVGDLHALVEERVNGD